MAEITINETIKLIIGVLVVVAIIIGAYLVFKEKIFGFFDTISADDTLPNLVLGLLFKK